MDTEVLLDFLEFGLAGTDLHPMIEGQPDSFPTFPVDQLCGEKIEPQVVDADEAEELIYRALGEVISSYSLSSLSGFSLSGGADTRLLFTLLAEFNPALFASLRFYVRRHPHLSLEMDRDAAIAKRLCERAGVTLDIEVPEGIVGAYLVPLGARAKPALCGLFGGELLGGQLLNILPFTNDEVFRCVRESRLKRQLIQLTERFSDLKPVALQIAFRILSYNALSAIYLSSTWIAPFRATLNAAVSPFLDPRFLKALFSIDAGVIADYSLYKRILKSRAARFLDLPVNNPLITSPPEITFPNWGVEPKSVPAPLSPCAELTAQQIEFIEVVNSYPEKRYSSYLRSVVGILIR